MCAPGRATTSKVGLGMNSVMRSRTTSFLRPLSSTKRNRLACAVGQVPGERVLGLVEVVVRVVDGEVERASGPPRSGCRFPYSGSRHCTNSCSRDYSPAIVDLGLSDEQQAARRLVRRPARQGVLARAGAGRRAAAASTRRCGRRSPRSASLDDGASPRTDGGWGASLLDLALVAEQVGRAAAPGAGDRGPGRGPAARRASAPPPHSTRSSRSSPASSCVTLALHRPVDGVAGSCPAGAVCDARRRARRRPPAARARVRRRPPTGGATWPPRRSPTSTSAGRGAELGAGRRRRRPVRGGARRVARRSPPRRWSASAPPRSSSACAYADRAPRVRRRRSAPSRRSSHPLADDATEPRRRPAARPEGGVEPRPRRRAAAGSWRRWRSPSRRRTAESATYDALHTHGGYGFMLEYDVQLHYRRARGWPRVWGDADAGYRRAADARYGTAGGRTDGLRLGRRRPRRSAARSARSSPSTSPPELEDAALRARRRPTTTASSGRSASGTGSPPTGRATASTCSAPTAMHVLERGADPGRGARSTPSSTSMMVAKVIRAVGSEWLQAEIVPKVVRGRDHHRARA